MGKMILRRLGLSIFILLAVSIIIFCATLLLPGDPARAILGQQATPERIAALEAQMNLDKSPLSDTSCGSAVSSPVTLVCPPPPAPLCRSYWVSHW